MLKCLGGKESIAWGKKRIYCLGQGRKTTNNRIIIASRYTKPVKKYKGKKTTSNRKVIASGFVHTVCRIYIAIEQS